MSDNIICVTDLKKNYKSGNETLDILNGVNLSIFDGETVSITGESGSGKSTLLHLIGGLGHSTDGEIIIDGVNITTMDETSLSTFRNKNIGFIFQSHYLLEEFTALENVMIPYLMHDFNKKRAADLAKTLLCDVGMEHRMKHHPSKMSGGERQRVAIARAFINNPHIILSDEPTGNLDSYNAGKAVDLLFNLSDRMKHTLIIVTHSSSIANMASKRFNLKNGTLAAY